MSVTLNFHVCHQNITRADSCILVADSLNYAYAHFDFCSSDWDGLIKTAVFTRGQDTYEQILEDDQCLIPWEVLPEGKGIFTVSVFAGNRITTNVVKVKLDASGWSFALESSQPPTEGVYSQILTRLADVEDTVVESAESAAQSATSAAESAQSAEQSMEAARTAKTAAEEAAASVTQYSKTAESWAVGGTGTRTGEDTDNSKYYAEQAGAASQTAVSAGNTATGAAQAATQAAGSASQSAQTAAEGAQIVQELYNGAVSDIAAAKTAAVGAIQTKGDQVLDSIPEDYTDLSDDVTALKADLTNLADGTKNLMLNAKFYDGYYNGTPAYTGTKTEGKYAGWGVCVIPVPKGQEITLSGFRARGGVNSCWLNSSNPADVYQTAWNASSNNGTKKCVTDWLGISDYNYLGLSSSPIASASVISLIANNDIFVLDYEAGSFDSSENLYSNNPNDWSVPAWNATYIANIPVSNDSRGLMSMHDARTVPESLSNGALCIRLYDSSNTLLHTYYHYLSSEQREIRYLEPKPDCAYIKLDFNTGSGSVQVTADDIRQLKMYVGVPIFTSYTVYPKVDFSEKSIPKQARTVMDGGYLPDYWLRYLRTKKDTLDSLTDTIGAHGFTFAFITDQHWPANYQKSPSILRWIQSHTVLDRIVSGGDIINEHNSIAGAMFYLRDWRDDTNGLAIRNIRGNHDNNSMQSDPDYYLGDGRFYANLIAPVEDKVSVKDGNLFYYEKIEAQKICIFYLDTGDMIDAMLIDFDAQISWMSDIVDTLDSEWSILVFQHIVFDGGTSENPGIYSTGQKTIDFLSTVDNCTVIGLICGHTHYDYSDDSNGWPIIVTSTDSSQRAETLPATAGTVTEQLFDIFHVDLENRQIYATRIGAGDDRNWSY